MQNPLVLAQLQPRASSSELRIPAVVKSVGVRRVGIWPFRSEKAHICLFCEEEHLALLGRVVDISEKPVVFNGFFNFRLNPGEYSSNLTKGLPVLLIAHVCSVASQRNRSFDPVEFLRIESVQPFTM